MVAKKKDSRLYNVLFPLWFMLLMPQLWLVVIPGNFAIDSIVLLIAMAVLKVEDKGQWYKRHILKIFGFGMLADVVGAAFMLLMMVLGLCSMGDEPYVTIPALLISAALIFVFNYFVTFKDAPKPLRLKMAATFAVATAPYTFLVPSSWIYG